MGDGGTVEEILVWRRVLRRLPSSTLAKGAESVGRLHLIRLCECNASSGGIPFDGMQRTEDIQRKLTHAELSGLRTDHHALREAERRGGHWTKPADNRAERMGELGLQSQR